MENDQPKNFSFESESSVDEEDAFSDNMAEAEMFAKLRQDLNDRISENQMLENRLADLQQKLNSKQKRVAEMQLVIDKQGKTIEAISSGAETQKILESSFYSMNEWDTDKSYSDGDYIAANMIVLLKALNRNGREMSEIRSKIVEFLCMHGFEANEERINTLSETLSGHFSKRSEQIKKKNCSLEDKIMGDDSSIELKHHFNALDESSTASGTQFPDHPFSMSLSELMKNTTCADFLNRTTEVTQDLSTAISKTSSLRRICSQLFEKLRGTAEFLEHILQSLEETKEGREMLQKIMDLKLDLDKSIHETISATDDLQKAEKSFADFREFVEQTFDVEEIDFENSVLTTTNEQVSNQKVLNILPTIQESPKQSAISQESNEMVEELKNQLTGLKESYESLQVTLKNELELKGQFIAKIIALEEKLKKNETEVIMQREQLKYFEEHDAKLSDDLEKMAKCLKIKDADVESLKAECHKLQQLLELSTNDIKKAQNELDVSKEQYNEIAKKCSALEAAALKCKKSLGPQIQSELGKIYDVMRSANTVANLP